MKRNHVPIRISGLATAGSIPTERGPAPRQDGFKKRGNRSADSLVRRNLI